MNRIIMMMFAAMLIVGPGAAMAEDYPGPHEAGPTIYTQLFDNERVRVSEIKFNAGDEIPMHHHSYDHSLYIVEGGQLTISKPDGTSSVLDAKPGDTREVTTVIPEHYPKKEFAGKAATVRLAVKEAKEKKLPEANDEFRINVQQTIDASMLLDLTNGRRWQVRGTGDAAGLGGLWDWSMEIETWGCSEARPPLPK